MIDSSQDEEPGPFAALDYPSSAGDPRPPSTAAIGALAADIKQLCPISGTQALVAAIMIDQGRAADALDYIDRERAERARAQQAKDDKKAQRGDRR